MREGRSHGDDGAGTNRAGAAPFADPDLERQMADVVDTTDGLTGAGAAAVITELAAVVGLITMEPGGHLVGSADPVDRLFVALLARQIDTLGLRGAR